MGPIYGMLIEKRRIGADLKEGQRYQPHAIDILCLNDEGGDLVGKTTGAGSDWVALDWDSYTRGGLPRVKKTPTAVTGPTALGVVHWDAGTVGDGKKLWVRVLGEHPYASVDGTTNVAKGDRLGIHSTGGQAAKVTSTVDQDIWGIALAARTDDSAGPLAVFLSDPSNILVT